MGKLNVKLPVKAEKKLSMKPKKNDLTKKPKPEKILLLKAKPEKVAVKPKNKDLTKKPKPEKILLLKAKPEKVAVKPKNNDLTKKPKPEKILLLKAKPEKVAVKPKNKDLTKKPKPEKILLLKAKPDKVAVKVKRVLPSKYVVEERVVKCLDALYKLEEKFNKNKLLFDINTTIFAELHCIKIPKNLGNVKFILPHPTITENQEISMVIADEKRNASDYYEDITNKTRVKTVIPLKELRKSYDQFELQRRLLTQQDLFLIDTRVYNHASHVLGKRFRRKHNMFIPVRFNKNDIEKSIDLGIRTTVLRLSEGETSIVAIGNISMDRDHVKDNILAMVQQLKKFPGGEANVRAINIKLPKSMSLPLYLTLRRANSVDVPKVKHSKPNCSSDVQGELSTKPGATVRVFPDGTVKVYRDNNSKQKIEEEDEEDMEEDEDENTVNDADNGEEDQSKTINEKVEESGNEEMDSDQSEGDDDDEESVDSGSSDKEN